MLDIKADNEMPRWSAETICKGHPFSIHNPNHALADGDPIYTSFIDIFGNNVSENQSKNWNKHWNIYITHWHLLRKLLNQQIHMHFISTSIYSSVPEQFHEIKHIIKWVNRCTDSRIFDIDGPGLTYPIKNKKTHCEPVKVWNVSNEIQTRFKIYCNCAPGDNPSQSETSGHIGGNGNHPYCKCKFGDTQKVRETDDGFHASFSISIFLKTNFLSIQQIF